MRQATLEALFGAATPQSRKRERDRAAESVARAERELRTADKKKVRLFAVAGKAQLALVPTHASQLRGAKLKAKPFARVLPPSAGTGTGRAGAGTGTDTFAEPPHVGWAGSEQPGAVGRQAQAPS